jgi:pSer/pThr/pTyr-binding forkhead associated (FHA) protein
MPLSDPRRVFLIADGKEVLLRGPVFNLGRRETNDLVIRDWRVSRLHAQIRIADGNITIFDLDSTGGTFVNNNRVRSQALKAGDVISLGGYPLIFNNDTDLNRTDKIEPDLITQEKSS